MNPTFVISEGYDVQGWAYTMHVPHFAPKKTTYLINQIYVAPKHRGKGIATQLLTEITQIADKESATLILDFQPAEFNSDATRLQLLYERFGFAWDETIGGMRREPN